MKKIAIVLLVVSMGVGCGKKNDGNNKGGVEQDTNQACQWDEYDDAASALALTEGEAATGFLCPASDKDWFLFEVPAGEPLVTVSLAINGPVSPLDLTFRIYDESGKSVLFAPESTEAAMPDAPLQMTTYLSSGSYRLVVEEKGQDAYDVFHDYAVTVNTAPETDSNEPNNRQEDTVACNDCSGTIGYRGDNDWFVIDGQENGILEVTLSMPAGGIQPGFTIYTADGTELGAQFNTLGKLEATALTYYLPVNTVGQLYVVVHDDDNMDSDSTVDYALTLNMRDNPDENEPNDHPSTATPLASITSSTVWTEWSSQTGYIASSGDADWFLLQFERAEGRRMMEVKVEFSEPGALPSDFRATAGVVRDVNSEAYICSSDMECQILGSRYCSDSLACSFLGGSCVTTENRCAGAAVCMPSGVCGAKYYSETAEDDSPGTLHFAVPATSGWSEDNSLHLFVTNGGATSIAPNNAYTVQVRVRIDPDINENSEAYKGAPPTDDDNVERHMAAAKEIFVSNCAGGTPVDTEVPDTADTATDDTDSADTDTATATGTDTTDSGGTDGTDTASDTAAIQDPQLVPGCCADGTNWTVGYLSYKYDQDWYKYRHPCPGADCMVRIVYDLGAGPVDHYLQIYAGSNAWFDNLASVEDSGEQSAVSSHFGGLDAADSCFYAYQGHAGSETEPFWYYLPIRDTIFTEATDGASAGSWDWSPDQQYRFCIEKVANSCQSPCHVFDDGECGVGP